MNIKYLGYSHTPCPNCGRLRVERWDDGSEICEKCLWIVSGSHATENTMKRLAAEVEETCQKFQELIDSRVREFEGRGGTE